MPKDVSQVRGAGVKHTIPFIGRYSGLWLVVTIGAIVVASWTSYLVFADRFEGTGREFFSLLLLQTGLIVAAVIGLAVFTTHRLAGPWIAIRRAIDAVKQGDYDYDLKIRTVDRYLKGVETSFNEMTARIRSDLVRDADTAADE